MNPESSYGERLTRRIRLSPCNVPGALSAVTAAVSEAALEVTRLVQADLHGADFCYANLREAKLFRCDLYGVDFTEARLEQATFRCSLGLSSTLRAYIRLRGGKVV